MTVNYIKHNYTISYQAINNKDSNPNLIDCPPYSYDVMTDSHSEETSECQTESVYDHTVAVVLLSGSHVQ